MLSLDESIRNIPKIGEKKEQKFNKLGIYTVRDLLVHFPRRYENRQNFIKIDELKDGESTSGKGKIIRYEKLYLRNRKTLVKILLDGGSAHFFINIFNNPYILAELEIGRTLYFYGKVSIKYGVSEFINPDISFDEPGSAIGVIYPVYASTAGLTTGEISKFIRYALANYPLNKLEYIDLELCEKFKIAGEQFSVKNIHAPESMEALKRARYRCIFDDFFKYSVYINSLRKQRKSKAGIAFEKKDTVLEKINSLPFELTNAQKHVVEQVLDDMCKNSPMQRLVQGDVGSGKTVIAFLAALNAMQNGYQAALMAPTQILASQHYTAAEDFFRESGFNISLLSASTKQKSKIYKDIKSGGIDLVIGTHAIIAKDVEFKKLGLVITDEQHRFGVMQRQSLSEKSGLNPDMLIMSATPIPRTLSMSLHGDLDVSVIDELPAGRKKIQTLAYKTGSEKKAYELAKQELKKGRQVFAVCPAIEESERDDLTSAKNIYCELSQNEFKDYKLKLLYGQMKSSEKDRIMSSFAGGEIDMLIATTVIEVGINIPNAAVLIIYDAERFGLSQLHQLRGRVGRGAYESYCILIHSAKSETAKERINKFVMIDDGFEIAKLDLKLRGAGEVFGVKQHGEISFKIGDVLQNSDILLFAKNAADYIYENQEKYKAVISRIDDEIKSEILIS